VKHRLILLQQSTAEWSSAQRSIAEYGLITIQGSLAECSLVDYSQV